MTFFLPSISSFSLPLPTSSVTFLDLRPPPAPPPEPPPPPSPPEPPDPPDPPPKICFSSSQSQSQPPLSTLSHLLQPFPTVDLRSLHTVTLLVSATLSRVTSAGSLVTFGCSFTAVCRPFSSISSSSGFCVSSMLQFTTPPLSQILDLSRSRSFTAVCRHFSGLYPASNFTRFDSGFAIYISSVYEIYLRDLVNCLDWLCLGLRCLPYSFMEMSLLSISPLWEKCLVAGTISIFGDAILSPKDMRFEDLQSHFVSKKSSLRRCSVSAFVVVGFFFPKFPLVSGLDDQDLSVLQGFSSRLIVPSTLVVEFVTSWVAMDAINQEAVEIILVCGSLMFSFYDLYLIYLSFNHLLVVLLALVALLLCISLVLVVIPPLFVEIEAF